MSTVVSWGRRVNVQSMLLRVWWQKEGAGGATRGVVVDMVGGCLGGEVLVSYLWAWSGAVC